MDTVNGRSTNSTDLLYVADQDLDANSLMLERKNKKSQPTGPLKTYRLPESSVLSQVKSFLPKMEQANKELEKKLQQAPSSDVDIENIDNDSHVIEMNLALVEQDNDTDTSDDSDSSEDFQQEVTVENFRISNKNTSKIKPSIVELSSGNEIQESCDDKT